MNVLPQRKMRSHITSPTTKDLDHRSWTSHYRVSTASTHITTSINRTLDMHKMKISIGWLLCSWVVPTTQAFTVTPKAGTNTYQGHRLSPPELRTTSTHHDLVPTMMMMLNRPCRTGTVIYADATATAEASKETFEFTVRHLLPFHISCLV